MNITTHLAQFCRLCVRSKGPMKNIYAPDTDLIEFNVKLYCCVPSIKIDDPNLPSLICIVCITKLRQAYEFRQQCLDSTRMLINKYKRTIITSINISDDDDDHMELTTQLRPIKNEPPNKPTDSSKVPNQPIDESRTGIELNGNKLPGAAVQIQEKSNEASLGDFRIEPASKPKTPKNACSSTTIVNPNIEDTTSAPGGLLPKTTSNSKAALLKFSTRPRTYSSSRINEEPSSKETTTTLLQKTIDASSMIEETPINKTTVELVPKKVLTSRIIEKTPEPTRLDISNIFDTYMEETSSTLDELPKNNSPPIINEASNIEEPSVEEEMRNINDALSKPGYIFPRIGGALKRRRLRSPSTTMGDSASIEETSPGRQENLPSIKNPSTVTNDAYSTEYPFLGFPTRRVASGRNIPPEIDSPNMSQEASSNSQTSILKTILSASLQISPSIDTTKINQLSSIKSPLNERESPIIGRESPINGRESPGSYNSSRILDLSNNSLSRILITSPRTINESPSDEITSQESEDYLDNTEECPTIEIATSRSETSPTIEKNHRIVTINASQITTPSHIDESSIHPAPAIINSTTSSLPHINMCVNLEEILMNAFKTLQPSDVNQESIRVQDEESIRAQEGEDSIKFNESIRAQDSEESIKLRNIEQMDAVDEFINENIIECYNNENDHTYSKHSEAAKSIIKAEPLEDVPNQDNIDLYTNIETNPTIETSANKEMENLVQIRDTAAKSVTSISMNQSNTRNFTAKRCEVIVDSELESPYICTSCDFGFPTISLLRDHLRSHIKNYKATCKKCGTSTPTQKQFATHRCVSGVSKFNCTFCCLSYKSAAALFKHKYHTHIKVHVCSVCLMKFTDAKMLNKHTKTHTRTQ